MVGVILADFRNNPSADDPGLWVEIHRVGGIRENPRGHWDLWNSTGSMGRQADHGGRAGQEILDRAA